MALRTPRQPALVASLRALQVALAMRGSLEERAQRQGASRELQAALAKWESPGERAQRQGASLELVLLA